jgi:hypothetical protein
VGNPQFAIRFLLEFFIFASHNLPTNTNTIFPSLFLPPPSFHSSFINILHFSFSFSLPLSFPSSFLSFSHSLLSLPSTPPSPSLPPPHPSQSYICKYSLNRWKRMVKSAITLFKICLIHIHLNFT